MKGVTVTVRSNKETKGVTVTNQGMTKLTEAEVAFAKAVEINAISKAESHVDASDIGVVKALHQLAAKQPERTEHGFIRVSKPGDDDYDGICTPEWRAARGR